MAERWARSGVWRNTIDGCSPTCLSAPRHYFKVKLTASKIIQVDHRRGDSLLTMREPKSIRRLRVYRHARLIAREGLVDGLLVLLSPR